MCAEMRTEEAERPSEPAARDLEALPAQPVGLARRVLAMQAAAGNRAVVRALRLARQPDGGPRVEARADGSIHEVLVGGVVVVRSSRPVDFGRYWTAAGDFALLVTMGEGADVEVVDDATVRKAVGGAVKRWRIQVARRTTRGELSTPAWETVADRVGAAGAPPPQQLPPLPPPAAQEPERPPAIPLQRGYPDVQLDDAVRSRGPLAAQRAAALSDDQMRQLAAEDRLALVDRLAAERSVDQTTIVRLLTTASPHQYAALAAGLRAERARLLRRLDAVMTGDDLDRYYGAAAPLLMSTSLGDEHYARYENAYHLEWSGPPLVRPDKLLDRDKPDQAITVNYEISWTEDGRLRIKWRKTWVLAAGPENEIVLAPDAIVALHFLNDDPDVGAKTGEVRYLPAAALLALVHRQFRREMWLAVQTATLVGGAAGAAGAVTWLGRVVAGIEAALASAAYIVDQFRPEIARTEGGREFLKRWDIAQSLIALYGLARVVIALPKALRKLVETYRSVRAAIGVEELHKAAEFDRRMGEINLRLNEAEREAQSARAAVAEEPRYRVADPDAPPPEPAQRRRVSDPGPGRWLDDFEGGTNMSEGAAAYEMQVTGKTAPGTGYYVDGVQFDGYKGGVLQECKYYLPGGRQERLLREQNMWVGIGIVEQAERQLRAAGRIPIEWTVASEEAAAVIRALFARNNIPIRVTYVRPTGLAAAEAGRVRVDPSVTRPRVQVEPEEPPPSSQPVPSTDEQGQRVRARVPQR